MGAFGAGPAPARRRCEVARAGPARAPRGLAAARSARADRRSGRSGKVCGGAAGLPARRASDAL